MAAGSSGGSSVSHDTALLFGFVTPFSVIAIAALIHHIKRKNVP